MTTNFGFSPKKISQEVEKKLAIKRLPSWAQSSEQIQKYFDDAIQQWFTPEQQRTLDGYIGLKGGAYSEGKVFINERTPARTEYQLVPSMVSTDATNAVLSMLTYPDLVDNLAFNGALTDNASRLLSGRFYCWAPPINPDMAVNYANYYWDATNADGLLEPDYIIMQRGSRDGNWWSARNHWYPVQYTDEKGVKITITDTDITAGKFIQAQRPIIEFVKDMELYDFGRNSRNQVDLVADQMTPEEIMFRDASSKVRIDGHALEPGLRILFTSIANPGENNRIYKVTIERKDNRDVYGLILDPAEMSATRPSGEPHNDDTVRVRAGTIYGGKQLYWDRSAWKLGQQKIDANQFPMFVLYDKTSQRLDSALYPESTFKGSSVFSVQIDHSFPQDSVYGMNIEKDKYGNFVYDNSIQSQTFTFTKLGQTLPITGMKFYKVMADTATNDTLFADWRESNIETRQYVSQTIHPTKFVAEADTKTGKYTFNKKYKLAVPVGSNPEGVTYPLVKVDVNGDPLPASKFTINGTDITLDYNLKDDSVVKVFIYNESETPNTDLGSYEIPSNLKHNANNAYITKIDESKLADHFYDIIQNQQGFTGSAVGINNYYNTARDMSVGRKIVQHDASLLPLMVHNSNENLDIVKATDFAKTSYNTFKNKFLNRLDEVNSKGYGTQTPQQVVVDLLKKINIGKSNEFAFWLSSMATTTTLGQTFIPPTPQYLGMLPLFMPRVRVKRKLNDQQYALYNQSHTGTYTRAYSTLTLNNGVETVIKDFRDDVLHELEMMIYRSVDSKFVNEDYVPSLSLCSLCPGVFRKTDFTRADWDKIALRSFEQWAISNNVDYRTNSTYKADNWMTWNYNATKYTANNQTARGSWKAIYMDYFDTLFPNTNPWEMLGFSRKPSWWDTEYTGSLILATGHRAYTDAKLWDDIEKGNIRRGARKGIDKRFVRTGFSTYNPIKADGTIVAPHEAVTGRRALVTHRPTFIEAASEWKFGDVGPLEFSYMNSAHYSFEQAMMLYRAKPAQWTNYFWDTPHYAEYRLGTQTQWLRDVTDQRWSVDGNTKVHGEDAHSVIGYQMWIADYLKHNHIDITRTYGNLIRGAGVKLTYRLGGFTKAENLTFVSDSFGLVSQENQYVSLLKSAVRKQEVLSGIKVRWTNNGFIVGGYDSSNAYFKYFKPRKTGRRQTVTVSGQSLVHYNEHETTVSELRYDTPLRTMQEVYEFVVGYGEYLETRGWIFEELQANGELFNWTSVAQGFVTWASQVRKAGDFVSLSPAAVSVKFATDHGNIDSVTQFSGGAWTLIDDKNAGIGMHEVNVARLGGLINVRLNDDVEKRIMLMRVNVSEYEHAVIFDNTTIFGDVMYLPAFGLHQPRLRAYGDITDAWNGRLEAPGFMIVGNDTLPNFEKLVEDFSKYYDSENPTSSVHLNNFARHVIGFQSRDYLRRLIINERSQVDFYKGYIKEKGTAQSYEKILRTSKNLRTPNYKVVEEWAFRVGEYGDVANDKKLEFLIKSNQLKQQPQVVRFLENAKGDDLGDEVVTFYGAEGADRRWLTRASANQTFPMHDRKPVMNLPTVGPVTIPEVDIIARDLADMRTKRIAYYNKHKAQPKNIWMLNNNGKWDLLELHTTDVKVQQTSPSSGASQGGRTTVEFNKQHSLKYGDIVFMHTESGAFSELNVDTYFEYSSDTFNQSGIKLNVTSKEQFFDPAVTSAIPVLSFYRSKFATDAQRDTYVNARNTQIVNIDTFKRPVIYNRRTNKTETYLTLWDPQQGVIPGIADAEIEYIAQQDPAVYNSLKKDGPSWGPEHVGKVWWDTSKALYLDYTQPIRKADGTIDDQATRNYRRDNWGKMLPEGEVTLYEWVKSPVNPVKWPEYVKSQTALNKEFGSWIPSGEAHQSDWAEVAEFDPNSGDFKTYYYFWVKDAIHIPNVKWRKRSTSELKRIITDPSSLDLPWFAPISHNEYVLSGVASLITDDNSVLQIVYKSLPDAGNVHKQWQLFQEGSSYNFDEDIWQNMIDSLVGESLPDLKEKTAVMRYPTSQLGNARGKTWFKDIFEARREFVAAANLYFQTSNVASNISLMNSVFKYKESAFNPNEREFIVTQWKNKNLIQIKNPARFMNGDAVILSTNGTLPSPLDKSVTYFVEREEGTVDKFKLKATPNAVDGISITNKGLGVHKLIRSVDAVSSATAALDMTKYWTTIDWYAHGYSTATTYTDVPSLDAANQMKFDVNDVIRVIDEAGNWTMYVLTFTRDTRIWNTVGRKDSTVRLNDKLFETHSILDSNGQPTADEIIAQKAIRKLSTVFNDVQSQIVFPMVYFVHNEQTVIDWVFKTSYISILGIDKSLAAGAVTNTDPLDDVMAYINEVKPYRTKLRGSIDQRTSDSDIISARGMDNDTSLVEHNKYVNEFNKTPSEADFSKIGANLRQQHSVVFFDHVSSTPKAGLMDKTTYELELNKYLYQDDRLNNLPAEMQVTGGVTPELNGAYSEITDYRQYPEFSDDFHPFGSQVALVNRLLGIYKRTVGNVEYFIWNLVGLGWIISTTSPTVTEWFYEDTSVSNLLSVKSPSEVTSWLSAGNKVGKLRDKKPAGQLKVVQTAKTRKNPEKTHVIDRVRRNVDWIETDAIERLRAEVFKAKPGTTVESWASQLHKFLIPTADGSAYFSDAQFKEVCKNVWYITSDEKILEIIKKAHAYISTIVDYLDTANRIKIYDPDATKEYVENVVESGFKGVRIKNQPKYRGAIGYSPSRDENLDGYYVWEATIYKHLYDTYVKSGMSDIAARQKLAKMGYASLVKYVPYLNQSDEVSNQSIKVVPPAALNADGTTFVDRFGDSYQVNLNDMPWDSENPLVNDDIELLDGFVNDMANFDNLGYDKQTRSMIHYNVDRNTHVFDVSELQIEHDKLGQLYVSISNYRPDSVEPIDFGIYVPGGSIVHPQGSINANYRDYAHVDNSLYTWDFGASFSDTVNFGSSDFSVQGTLIRDPLNPNKVVVSAPRTVKPYAMNWNNENAIYPTAERTVYPFTVSAINNITNIRIGKHSLKNNDTVILLANDLDAPSPSGAQFNQVNKLYTVTVVDDQTVRLYDGGKLIRLDASNLAEYQQLESNLVFSMFNVVVPPALSNVRIDTFNYDAFYGRYLDGGRMFNKAIVSGTSELVVPNHKLNTGDRVYFTASSGSRDLGSLTLNTTYYVIKRDNDRIQLTRTIDDAILSTNQVVLGAGVADISMSIVNFWIASTTQSVIRERTWHDSHRHKTYAPAVKEMREQFANDELIRYSTDRIADHGFARPSIDEGSMRDLVRSRLQEHLEVTVFHDERKASAGSNRVFDTNGVLMYNKGGSPYAYRLTYTPANRLPSIMHPDDDALVETIRDIWFDDISIFVTFEANVPLSGIISVNDEHIKYGNRTQVKLGSVDAWELSDLQRSYSYTSEQFIIPVGSLVQLVSAPTQVVDKALTIQDEISPSINDRDNYSYASTALFDISSTGYFAELNTDNSEVARQIRSEVCRYDHYATKNRVK